MNSARIELDSRLHPLLSPEGVYLDLPVAGPGLRILAYGIDLIAILILIAGLASVLFLFLPIGTWIGHTLGSLVREFTQSARTGKSPDRVLQDTLALMIAIFVLVHTRSNWDISYSGK